MVVSSITFDSIRVVAEVVILVGFVGLYVQGCWALLRWCCMYSLIHLVGLSNLYKGYSRQNGTY